jgi:hypothetical protein
VINLTPAPRHPTRQLNIGDRIRGNNRKAESWIGLISGLEAKVRAKQSLLLPVVETLSYSLQHIKCYIVPVQIMKGYRVNRTIAPFLNLGPM